MNYESSIQKAFIFLIIGTTILISVPHFTEQSVTAFENRNFKTTLSKTFSGMKLSFNSELSKSIFLVREYKLPGTNDSVPLYPLYDRNRNVVWIGDSAVDSSRILEFNLNINKFTVHNLNDTSLVTVMAIDQNNSRLWYVDPLMRHLGLYVPSSNTTSLFNIPTQGAISRITLDLNHNVWLTSPDNDELLIFDVHSQKFSTIRLPTMNAIPVGILTDKKNGIIWIAESIGKLASINPANHYDIREYSQLEYNNHTRYSPTEIFMNDSNNNSLYISDHDNHTISVFNTVNKTFKSLHEISPEALPFGMTMDNHGYLWVAEHTANKIAVIDPKTGQSREIQLPNPSPYIQFLTSDNKGNIWFTDQRQNSLGVITSISSK